MKKIIAALVGMMAAAPGFAAFQYVGSSPGYIQFDSNMSFSSQLAGSAGMIDFGYYSLGSNDLISMNNGAVFQFKAGDQIGLWVKDFNGLTTSTKMADADWVGYGTLKSDGTLRFMAGGGPVVYRSEYDYLLSGTESGGAPSGQPLPGVLATLLVGGGMLAARKLRKK